MDCLRCKEEMIKAKLKGDAVGTVGAERNGGAANASP